MSSKLECIYGQLPIALQNVAVSYQGWRYVRQRYKGNFSRYFGGLMRSQWFSREQFGQLQIRVLRDLLAEVVEEVPYYRRNKDKYGGGLETINLEGLQDLPILEKSQVRADTEGFVNRRRLKYGYALGHTSGTTGSPFVWPSDFESGKYNLAFRERQYRWAGVSHCDRSARFGSRVILGRHNGPPYWRHNTAENQWLFSSYHMTEQTLPYYYEALVKHDFVFLDGYPSSLFSIAKWINRNAKSGQWSPWAIITTAETLMDFQRSEIERAFGCKIFNFYSSSEGAPFVTQCPAGRMHMNPESGIIEFLRADGTRAEPGEDTEMIVTSFFKRSLPLIRYRIGDRGILSEDQDCPCGRRMPIIECISGRESDAIHTTERGRVGSAALSTAFYAIPSRVSESQLEQIGTDSFILRYVPVGDPLTQEEESTVIDQFRSRLGASVKIDIRKVREVVKGKRGKSCLIIGLNIPMQDSD